MIQQSYTKPFLIARPSLLWQHLKRSWPFGVWVGVVALCAWLYFSHGQFWGFSGVVQARVEPVAPVETARLVSIDVELGQRVKAGDLLARMDTSILNAQLAVDEARILEAESSIAGFQQNMLTIVGRFDIEVSDAESALLQSRIQQEQDLAQLEEMKKELKRREDLLAQHLIDATDVYDLRPQMVALEKAIEGFPAIKQIHEDRLRSARAERAELQRALKVGEGETVTVALERKMEARRKILDSGKAQRLIQKEAYVLRATQDGIVSRIYLNPGVVVQAGEEVMRLVSEASEYVEGFLPEAHLGALQQGQAAQIIRQHNPKDYDAVVVSIAPEIQALPGRVSPIRNQPIRGRRVLLAIADPKHDLVPGETVMIRPMKKTDPLTLSRTAP